ncbi:hypothetical protein LKO27_10590 [Tessaracoccus sp. OS52]|uniref:hypothetical protein n=1 Tax=Tessaracoccus sp. OS52 TaxID=2886691 RepID=UPI001D0F62FA|nr:hypothetical protein [Tessaracoccus sp. OS52]MCC2593851.1 hypothetical protein [Tessaracoccus sp. OS52]
MDLDVSLVAGSISSVIFAGSVLPMVAKALRTRDLSSYSLGNLMLANVGNLVHTVYIVSLPAGPIWALHGFYLLTTGLMFVLYLTHARHPEGITHDHPDPADHGVALPEKSDRRFVAVGPGPAHAV